MFTRVVFFPVPPFFLANPLRLKLWPDIAPLLHIPHLFSIVFYDRKIIGADPKVFLLFTIIPEKAWGSIKLFCFFKKMCYNSCSMGKTYIPNKEEIKRIWYLVDAKDKILGRLAARVAAVLRGKHKPDFTPHLDMGDEVIVINASKIRVTGRKLKQKVYRRYSGYPGGLKEMPISDLLKKKPELVFKLAVKRMLPKGSLGKRMFKKLRVYAQEQHPHNSQHPRLLNLSRTAIK